MEDVVASALALAAGGGLFWTAGRAWRNRSEPGAAAFALLTAVLVVTTAGQAAVLVDEAWQLLVGTSLWLVVPVVWALFVFAVTGRYDVRSRRRRTLFLAPAAYLATVNVGQEFLANAVLGVPLEDGTWTLRAGSPRSCRARPAWRCP